MGCYKSSRDVKMVREGEIDVPLVSSAQWSLSALCPDVSLCLTCWPLQRSFSGQRAVLIYGQEHSVQCDNVQSRSLPRCCWDLTLDQAVTLSCQASALGSFLAIGLRVSTQPASLGSSSSAASLWAYLIMAEGKDLSLPLLIAHTEKEALFALCHGKKSKCEKRHK